MLICSNLTCILIENFPAPVICDFCFKKNFVQTFAISDADIK